MKIALFADVHANLFALQAIIQDIESWKPDFVVMGGDLVNRGPRPAECLELIQEKQAAKSWQLVRGNHEDYVIKQNSPEAAQRGPSFDVHRASYWTYQKLNCDVQPLIDMPFAIEIPGPQGEEIRFVHASMLGNREGIYPETSDKELGPRIGEPKSVPAVLGVGHTHRPLIRSLKGTLVVNAGSAGLPFDGDVRPSYARLTCQNDAWTAEIVRVDYDLAEAEKDFYRSGYVREAGPLVELVLIELREARSQLFGWAIRHQERALRGEITMEESVRECLLRQGYACDF
jgi:predicted phosphodiesterase